MEDFAKMNQSFEPISRNGTFRQYDDNDNEYPYDRSDVRAVSIILYSIVFIACFFGNLIVILVVTIHWRMRSITNFCLANLAFADFCVSIFCVYQNMYFYFMSSWIFGSFLCKMYYFITELSHTASILILVVICIERYLAIVHPMRCKEWLTLTRLRLTIIGVWGTSAVYSSPRLYFTNTITMPRHDGEEEVLCIPIRTLYDSQTFDMISFGILFVLPLLVISILYSRIALALWESSKNQMQQPYCTSSPSLSAGAPESCSSSEHDCEGTNSLPINKHSCLNILCCTDPCKVKHSKRNSNPRFSYSKASTRRCSGGSVYRPRRSTRSSNNFPMKTDEEYETNSKSINCNDPVVVLKFEKKSSLRKGKRSRDQRRCTILFNGCGSPTTTEVIPDFTPGNLNPLTSPESKDAAGSLTCARNRTRSVRGSGTSKTLAANKLRRMTVTRGGKYGSRALESRRRIIKMLIIIVFAFAVCNLPFHARKFWQYFGSGYVGGSTFSSIFTPVTFLIMYANSGINPILYAFMSRKFRACFKDLINCNLRRSLLVARNASVRSTHVVPLNNPV